MWESRGFEITNIYRGKKFNAKDFKNVLLLFTLHIFTKN